MPFVKLDCGILNSTLWFEREAREIFITALLMAEPLELTDPLQQIAVKSLNLTGWSVPPGWYGFVPAAGIGIIHRARVPDEAGFDALVKLGDPEQSSRSPEFDGRRLVRVDGGFIVLNYMKYRERDYTAAIRSARYRKNKQEREASRRNVTASHRNITQAEAEVEGRSRSRKKILNRNNKLATDAGVSTTSKPNGHGAQPTAINFGSKHPIFKGNRFVVFDWQLEDIGRLLGPHLEEFDIHTFFDTVDQQAVQSGEVVPQRDKGLWLQARILDEANKRGLKIANGNGAHRLTQDAESMNAGVLALLKADGTIK